MTIREETFPSSRCLGPGELASLLGTTVKALRVYEKAGLLTPERRDGGWRVYDRGCVKTRESAMIYWVSGGF
jgi:hypothetical protein